MSFLKSSIIIIRCDFKIESCFSSALGYPRLAVVGELGSDDAKYPQFLLLAFLCLPLAMWLSLVLVGLTISDWSLSLLLSCEPVILGVSALLGRPSFSWAGFGCGGLWDGLSSMVQMETRRILSPAAPLFLCLECSRPVTLWTVIGVKIVIPSLGLGVRALLGEHLSLEKDLGAEFCGTALAQGHRWRLEGSCPTQLHDTWSCQSHT